MVTLRLASSVVKSAFWPAVFVVLVVFFMLTPITGDDFTFLAYHNNLHGFSDYLAANQYMYRVLNGRVIGNLSALLLANHLILSSLFRAVVVLIILYVGLRVVAIKTVTMRNFTIAAAVFIPASIFSQTYGWRAGFYNYITPLAVAALIAFVFVNYPNMGTAVKRSVGIGTVFALSVMECLFVENVTLGFVVISAVILLATIIKKRHFIWLSTSMMVGAIAGTIIMFSSPIYGSVAAGNDDYRQTALGSGGSHLINTVFHNSVDYTTFFMAGSPLLYTALSMAAVYAISTNKARLPRTIQRLISERVMKTCLLAVLVAAPLYFLFSQSFTGLDRLSTHLYEAYAVANFMTLVVYMLALGLSISTYIKDAFTRYTALSLVAIAVLVTGPLLVVSPFGGRNFYISYILIVLAIGSLFNHLFAKALVKYEEKGLKILSYAALITIAGVYIGIFTVIFRHQAYNQRQLSNQVSAGKTEVVLRKYPFNLFIQDSHNVRKAKRVYAQCHCVYAQCWDCDNFSLRFK